MAKKEKSPAPAEETKNNSAGEATEVAAKPPKGGGKLKLIIIVALAMVLGGGAAIGLMKAMGGGQPAPPPVEAAAPAPADPVAADTVTPIEGPKKTAEAAPPPAAAAEGAAAGTAEGAPPEATGPINIEFKPFIVNLNDAGGKRFLKLTMSLEAETPDIAAEVNAKMPLFRDVILLLLSSLSYDDISAVEGKLRLRNQMLNRINTQLTAGKVKSIYFSEFVVQ